MRGYGDGTYGSGYYGQTDIYPLNLRGGTVHTTAAPKGGVVNAVSKVAAGVIVVTGQLLKGGKAK